MVQPINPTFNEASCHIASHIFPLGFDVCRSAPNTMDELCERMDCYGRMAIWSGDYSHTCFADTETWLQFRAWHDWVHYRFGAAFTMPGEHTSCHIQAGQLMRLYGRGDDVVEMIALLFCNVIGQLEAGMETGKPVPDGHAYCAANVASWRDYAKNIVANQGRTDVDAIEFAKQAYDYRKEFGPRVPWQALPAEIALPFVLRGGDPP
jgi:hypothetical protein